MAKLYEKTCRRCGCAFTGKKNSLFCPECMVVKRAEHQKAYQHKVKKSLGIESNIVRLESGGDLVGRGITHTLEETAAYFGTTRQNIQAIEANAFKKLRKAFLAMGYTKSGDML